MPDKRIEPIQNALPKEIVRVKRMRDLSISGASKNGLSNFDLYMMGNDLKEAEAAISAGKIVDMIVAYEDLKQWKDF